MPEVLVRTRRESDIHACAQVLLAVHALDGYPVEGVSDPEAWLRPPGMIAAWVAELDGAVMGHALLTEPHAGDAAPVLWAQRRPDDRLVVGGRLFVHPAARGRSLARRLFVQAMAYAHDAGLRLVGDVMAKDRAAIALYEQLGLHQIGTAGHDDGHGHLIPAFCYAAPDHPASSGPT